MYRFAYARLAIAFSVAISCVGAGAQQVATIPSRGAPPQIAGTSYRVGAGDTIEISVWKEEGMQKNLLVRPDGGVSFPLVGEIQAAGHTPEELEAQISARLARFIPSAVVSVSVVKFPSPRVYVIGKVGKPGDFELGRGVDVMQALSLAGGLTPFADPHGIKVLRKQAGESTAIRFDYAKVQDGKDLSQNIELENGDVVVVP
jgi:polysaccharide export outer membrane protein